MRRNDICDWSFTFKTCVQLWNVSIFLSNLSIQEHNSSNRDEYWYFILKWIECWLHLHFLSCRSSLKCMCIDFARKSICICIGYTAATRRHRLRRRRCCWWCEYRATNAIIRINHVFHCDWYRFLPQKFPSELVHYCKLQPTTTITDCVMCLRWIAFTALYTSGCFTSISGDVATRIKATQWTFCGMNWTLFTWILDAFRVILAFDTSKLALLHFKCWWHCWWQAQITLSFVRPRFF